MMYIDLRKTQEKQKSKLNKLSIIFLVLITLVILTGLSFYALRSNDVIPGALAQSLPPIHEIQSGIPGYCLDNRLDLPIKGNIIDSWKCNNTAAQAWTVKKNSIVNSNGYCLSIYNNGTSSGDKIVLDSCNGSLGQVWVSAIDGYENPNSALCLDAPDAKTGEQLAADQCNNLTQPQEAWMPSKYSENSSTGASTSCKGTEGQLIACYAAKELVAWQAPGSNHPTLLNNYTDGNNYELWCADFVSYVYNEAGYPFTNGERDGWDEYLASNIQYQGFTTYTPSNYTPQPGDVAYFDYGNGHVEIVAIGGTKPLFIYGDSGTTDPTTGLGELAENTHTNDGLGGQLVNYYSPN